MQIYFGPRSATVVILIVIFLWAHPLVADQENLTAFQTLESFVQGREIPLETGNRGLAVLGVVAGAGFTIGSTWIGMLPVTQKWEREDPAHSDSGHGPHGIYTGLAAGAAANLLAVSIANLAYPPNDIRASYAAVLDVVDPQEREQAALAALQGFYEQTRKRKTLRILLSVAGISAAIAAHLGIGDGTGNLADYPDVAWGFSLSSAAMLSVTFYALLPEFEDPSARLYRQYLGSNP